MNLLGTGGALESIKGKARVAIVDHRAPLTSPITLLVMIVKSAGFEWYGGEKIAANGQRQTTSFLDTTTAHADGRQTRRVTWTLCGDAKVDIGGESCGLHALCAALGYAPPVRPGRAAPQPPRGSAEVIAAMRLALGRALTDEMPFNERGRLLLDAAATTGNYEVRGWILDLIELYRGFCWKLATPAGHPPHPEYGYPLERHLRYTSGKRRGDVRASLCVDERMEELRTLGLR